MVRRSELLGYLYREGLGFWVLKSLAGANVSRTTAKSIDAREMNRVISLPLMLC